MKHNQIIPNNSCDISTAKHHHCHDRCTMENCMILGIPSPSKFLRFSIISPPRAHILFQTCMNFSLVHDNAHAWKERGCLLKPFTFSQSRSYICHRLLLCFQDLHFHISSSSIQLYKRADRLYLTLIWMGFWRLELTVRQFAVVIL